MRSNTRKSRHLAVLLAFGLSPLCAQEQIQRQNRPSEQTQQAPTETLESSQSPGKRSTITGCLRKGSDLNEYMIVDKGGRKYLLSSSTIDLVITSVIESLSWPDRRLKGPDPIAGLRR
jgi:hypothetical protein